MDQTQVLNHRPHVKSPGIVVFLFVGAGWWTTIMDELSPTCPPPPPPRPYPAASIRRRLSSNRISIIQLPTPGWPQQKQRERTSTSPCVLKGALFCEARRSCCMSRPRSGAAPKACDSVYGCLARTLQGAALLLKACDASLQGLNGGIFAPHGRASIRLEKAPGPGAAVHMCHLLTWPRLWVSRPW